MAKEVEEASEQMKVSGLCLCCVSYPVLYKSKTVSPVLCLCLCRVSRSVLDVSPGFVCALLRG